MQILTGTSGYSYKEWKGNFYPEKIKPADMLEFYAGRLATVEINNTFYRMPRESVLAGWAEKTPERFSFVIKASRRITHQKRLKDAESELEFLMKNVGVLGEKRGPMLFQMPPYFKQDVEVLRDFLKLLPEGWQAAMEFRHASWFDDATYEVLREQNKALVVADTEKTPDPEIVSTADYGYLRLRRENYSDDELKSWADKVLAQPWKAAWVFFKHEDDGIGPAMAEKFAGLVEESA